MHWTGEYNVLGNIEEACRFLRALRILPHLVGALSAHLVTAVRCGADDFVAVLRTHHRVIGPRYQKYIPGCSPHHDLSRTHSHHGGLITAGVYASILFQYLQLTSRHSGLLWVRNNACTTQLQLQGPLNDGKDQEQKQNRYRLLHIKTHERLLPNGQLGCRPFPELPH